MFITQMIKRAFLLFFFVSTFCFSYSQGGDFGLAGAIGPAYFINSNFNKKGTIQSYRLTLSDYYGIQFTKNFSHGFGVELGLLPGTIRQGYKGTFGSEGSLPGLYLYYQPGESYKGVSKINVIQIPFIVRHEGKKGTYFELGGGYEMITGASYSATYSNPSFKVNYNTSNLYPKANFLTSIGFGNDMSISKSGHFRLSLGLRLTFGVMDLQGTDGHGQPLLGPNSTVVYYPNMGPPYYAAYHETKEIELNLNASLFYRFSTTNLHKKEIKFN